jgi:hypothetical protein
MRYYDELFRIEDREGFTVIVDKTWEDIALRDCFDDSCYDIRDMEIKVNRGDLDWFMLRVRASIDGHELGSAHLGGCLYEDAREVLSDGTAEDLIEQAIMEAKDQVYPLLRRLLAINERLENPEIAYYGA